MAEAFTFEKVWAALMEDRERQKESDRLMQERIQENDRQMRERMREHDQLKERMQETDRRIGELGNRFGELAEHLVAPSIMEKFNELNFNFDNISQDHRIKENGRLLAEIDILLENGEVVIAVEVKSKPLEKDVDQHVSRMEILRRRADARNDKRRFQGAIAGAIMSESVRDYAHKTGFYVIEQTGDTVRINIPEDFTPRQW